jgi:hypothetical protein
MIEDTVYGLDPDVYHNTVRDVGRDGIFRDHALDPEAEMTPYGATRKYFGEAYGLKQWVFAQADQPDHFAKLVEALERREERRLQLVAESPAEFVGFSCVEGLWGPEKMRRYELPFYERWIPYLQRCGKVCAVHADAINLHRLKEVVALTGVDVVEAFTPPPVGNLSLAEARQAWGPDVVIWVNFPETVFWFGPEEVKRYTVELLKSDAPGRALVLGFTEMGLWGAADDATAAVFRACTLAIMEALEEHGVYPIK